MATKHQNRIRKMLLDVIQELDYDDWKHFQKDTSEDYEAACEQMTTLVGIAESHGVSIPTTQQELDRKALLDASRKWLSHYDQFVRQEHIGDEPGIPEMRDAVARLSKRK